MAGFFDGEGCINITVAGTPRRCVLRAMLVNTDLCLLQAIQNEFGGAIYSRQSTKCPHWKPFRHIVWQNKNAYCLLSRIGQFLILKKPQLAVANEFIEVKYSPDRLISSSIVGVTKDKRKYRTILKPEIINLEFELKERMHKLNKKGNGNNAVE